MDKNSYSILLDALGAGKILNHENNADISDWLKDTIIKVIFYSSKIEGNLLSYDAASLLIANGLIDRDGKLEDYIELLNHKTLYEQLYTLKDKKITVEDLFESQRLLFKGLIGKRTGKRKGPGSIAGWLFPSGIDNDKELINAVEILNRPTNSHYDALWNAIEFHLRFVYIHVFGDGNGRISRLFMNLYLLKNGLNPIFIITNEKEAYFESINIFRQTGNADFFFALMTAFYFRDKLSELSRVAKEIKKKMGEEYLPFLDTILIYANEIDKKELENDIRILISKNHDPIGALWLIGYSKMKDVDFASLLESDDPKIRIAALWALDIVSDKEFNKYSKLFENVALNDVDERVRLFALNVLGYHGIDLTPEIVEKLLHDKSKNIILQLCNVLHYTPSHRNVMPLIYPLINESDNDIKMKAYQALAVNADSEGILKLLENLEHEDKDVAELVESFIIYRLIRIPLKDDDGRVASSISALTKSNRHVRGALLMHLSSSEKLDQTYLPLIDKIVRERDSTPEERAYAIYIMGKFKSYEEISNAYNIRIDRKNSLIENVALALTYLNWSPSKEGIKELFDPNSCQLSAVTAIEISRLIKENKFGTDFLLHWKRH
ncbi:MAG: Fic family protein [Candidatus Micrarchaeia archaeon]